MQYIYLLDHTCTCRLTCIITNSEEIIPMVELHGIQKKKKLNPGVPGFSFVSNAGYFHLRVGKSR